MTKHFDLPYVNHILDAITNIEYFIEGVSRNYFIENEEKQSAVIRQIEIIGEAVKNLSNELRNKYPEIQWNKITGMRDKIIHKYFEVDLNIVWEVIKKDLPVLKQKILKIKEDLDKENGKKRADN